jgi:hypothetical protein
LYIGKQLFEKANGRIITDSDLKQLENNYHDKGIASFSSTNLNLEINECENQIAYHIKSIDNYINKGGNISDEFGRSVYFNHSHSIINNIEQWQKLTGKKMEKQDEIRIYGKPFLKKYKGGTSGGGTSIITKIIGAVIGAIIGGVLLKFLPSFVAIIGGGVAGWFLGATLKKKFIVIGIIAAVVLLFGQRIIGSIGNKTSTSQTQTAAATVTQNVNFRKGPSTDNEVIRQLKQGNKVTLTGKTQDGWTQITHSGDTGWVSSEYLRQ